MIAQDRQPYLKTRHDVDFQFFGSPTEVACDGEATTLLLPHGTSDDASRFGVADSTRITTRTKRFHSRGDVRFAVDGQLRMRPGYVGVRAARNPAPIQGGWSSRPARMLLMCAPAGFEKFVLELCAPVDAVPAPPNMTKLMAAAARLDVDILGPLPDDPMGNDIGSGATVVLERSRRPDPQSTRRSGQRGKCGSRDGSLRAERHLSPSRSARTGKHGSDPCVVHRRIRELPRSNVSRFSPVAWTSAVMSSSSTATGAQPSRRRVVQLRCPGAAPISRPTPDSRTAACG